MKVTFDLLSNFIFTSLRMGTNNEANVKRSCLSALDTIDLASCERSLKRMSAHVIKRTLFSKPTLGFEGWCVWMAN